MAISTKKIYYAQRKSPWGIQWGSYNKRKFNFYKTKEERDAQYDIIDKLSVNGLAFLHGLDKPRIKDIEHAVTIIADKGISVTFIEMLLFWKKHNKSHIPQNLQTAAKSYINWLGTDESRSKAYVAHAKNYIQKLCNEYGKKLVSEITRDELEEWISRLPFSPVTKRNYRSTIRAAWGYFERKRWIEKNVAHRLDSGKIVRGEIGILSVEETETLFKANQNIDPEICGLMALGLFGGMRSSAISRLSYKEINFPDRGIETPAHKTKNKKRRYIENLPDNLWAWVEWAPKTAFNMPEREFIKRRREAYKRAELLIDNQELERLTKKGIATEKKLPPHNAFRHSFVSYHVAWKRNFHDTALIISHEGTKILFEHYLGVAKRDDAEKYFNIYPPKKRTTLLIEKSILTNDK